MNKLNRGKNSNKLQVYGDKSNVASEVEKENYDCTFGQLIRGDAEGAIM